MRRPDALASHHRWNDFLALPEEDRRELVDGRLEEIDLPNKWHERAVARLAAFLSGWADRQSKHLLSSGFKVRVSERRGVMPDLQILSDETFQLAGENGLESGHPELVVEVVSPTSRAHDRVRKLGWYAQIGVPEYWVVDLDAHTLECMRLRGGQYVIDQAASGDDVFRPKSMKALRIPLAQLWPPAKRHD